MLDHLLLLAKREEVGQEEAAISPEVDDERRRARRTCVPMPCVQSAEEQQELSRGTSTTSEHDEVIAARDDAQLDSATAMTAMAAATTAQ